jgi:hypothetical protein
VDMGAALLATDLIASSWFNLLKKDPIVRVSGGPVIKQFFKILLPLCPPPKLCISQLC